MDKEPATLDPGGDSPGRTLSRGPARILWLLIGCLSLVVGGIGVVVPGLPTTVFMIVAASCFARSVPRFERWILALPGVGPLVRDYRRGLGMPRRAKRAAVTTILVMSGVSAGVLVNSLVVRGSIVVVAIVGVWYLIWRVPTRLADRTNAPDE
ncbi:MAG: YbaN family protein [Acidimicrobiales bacterium]|nr:YbaN family protein [Acidimicrobiales bacterium]